MALEINLSKEKNKINKIDLEKRKTTFDEVVCGYDENFAVSEAKRCLGCKNHPCTSGCPLSNYIPDFMKCVSKADFEGAYKLIKEKSNFPSVCSRVCDQKSQCEGKCTRGLNGEPVAIGMVERFITDWHSKNCADNSSENNNYEPPLKNEQKTQIDLFLNEKILKNGDFSQNYSKNTNKIAIIGSGPSGLACGEDLAKLGYDVTIFEKNEYLGGVMFYGIPDFRLPREIVLNEIQKFKSLGVKFVKGKALGKDFSLDELFNDGFKCVYIATGADTPKSMGIEGENLDGVMLAQNFLKDCKINGNRPSKISLKDKIVMVVGGGNVAIDSARTAVRLGAKSVQIIYRRSAEEMPARKDEINEAIQEGVVFNYLTHPVKVLPKSNDENKVGGLECVKMQLGEPDEKGRKRPIKIEGSEHFLETDFVLFAIGSSVGDEIKNLSSEIDQSYGLILVNNETGETSKKTIFAGGDVVTGPKTVVHAVKAGKNVAKSIDKMLQ